MRLGEIMRDAQSGKDLAGRAVAITGASAGVGRAAAHRFARSGASVALLARDHAALEETKAEVEKVGGRAVALPVDVADANEVFAAAAQAEAALGPLEVWVNDAMLTVFSPVHEMTPEEFRRVTEVTYLGFVHGTMAALRHMRPRKRGIIIQIGSSLAYRGIPLQSAYCGAKHAIRGFTNSLRAELLHDGGLVKLVMIELPAVNTPQFDWARIHIPHEPRPVAPIVEPEVVAGAIFQAAVKPRRELWLGFSTAKVILGNMLLPAYADRYLAVHGYDAQQTARIAPPGRKDNLLAPVTNLHRTRGSFSGEAFNSAALLTGTVVRLTAAIAGLGLAFAAGLLAGWVLL